MQQISLKGKQDKAWLVEKDDSQEIVQEKWEDPWCNGYRRSNWTRRHEFKSSSRLIAFHIALIPLERYESNNSPSSYG